MQIDKISFAAIFGLFTFILLFVNREFSVAVNRGFTRHKAFIEKPAAASGNRTIRGKVGYRQHFFSKSHLYRDYSLHRCSDNWESSMVYNWKISGFLDRYLISEKALNIRNSGLSLFLFQLLSLFLLFRYFKDEKKYSIVSVIIFGLLTSLGDADLDTATHLMYGACAGLLLLVQLLFSIERYLSSQERTSCLFLTNIRGNNAPES